MNGRILTRQEIVASQWDDFVLQSPQGAVYATTAWLDLMAPGWSAIVVEGHQGWQAIFPLVIQKRFYGDVLVQPAFTQHLGPIFKDPEGMKPVTCAEQRVDILREILETIPQGIVLTRIACSPNAGPVFPFHWQGFRLETRYTYRLSLQQDLDGLMEGMHTKKRNSIRKGQQSIGRITTGFQEDALRASAMQAGYLSVNQREKLLDIARNQTKAGTMLQVTAYDPSGTASGVALVAFFRDMAYLIYQQWIKADQRGIMDALIWSGMITSREHGARCFDFEGSMLEPVEKVFREFGADAVPYIVVERDRRPAWFNIVSKLRSRR